MAKQTKASTVGSTTQKPVERMAQPAFPETYYRDPRGYDRYVVQEKSLYTWRAPSKIERQRSTTEQRQLILMAILVIVLLALITSEYIYSIIFALISVVYILLVMTPPTFTDCSITTIGVKVGEKYYFWPDMSQFWWEKHGERQVLYFRIIYPDYGTLRLIVPPADEELIQTTIGTYLLYKKPYQTKLEKLTKKILAKLPIDLEFLQL